MVLRKQVVDNGADKSLVVVRNLATAKSRDISRRFLHEAVFEDDLILDEGKGTVYVLLLCKFDIALSRLINNF